MAKLSRVEKHRKEADYTTEDIGREISSDELRKFQDRLNKINSDNFEAPKETPSRAADYDPIHARRVEEPERKEEKPEEDFDDSVPDDSDFDLHFTDALKPEDDNELTNDYLSRYINEVKQYNIDQGNAASGNTQLNILKGLDASQQQKAPETPYPSNRKKETPAFERKNRAARTTEVPFINSRVTPSSHRPAEPVQDDMSVDDIASKVQDMASDNNDNYEANTRSTHMNTDEFTRQLEMERTTNQKLLDQTTQMQARMDDVGENLNDVSNKMRHTNQILNIVLIVVIVALVIVFGILIYWIVLAGGAR